MASNSSYDNNFALDPQINIRETSPDFVDLNNQIEEARLQSLALDEKRQVIQDKIAKKKKKEERRKKNSNTEESDHLVSVNMSEVLSNENDAPLRADQQAMQDEENDRKAEDERRRNREPPVIFADIDVSLWNANFCCLFFL